MVRVGLIGLGYWGPNLARVLSQLGRCHLVAGCDVDPSKVESILRQYPSVRCASA